MPCCCHRGVPTKLWSLDLNFVPTRVRLLYARSFDFQAHQPKLSSLGLKLSTCDLSTHGFSTFSP
jgi:hypothetical protein